MNHTDPDNRDHPAPALKAALVGTGAIARDHLGALAALSTVEVAAVCDLSAARAEATAQRFGVERWYTDHRRMIAETEADLVHVTTPPTSHFTITRDCLTAGRNVLCEKPITVEYSEFLELKELAIRHKRLLIESQSARFHSSIRRIGELVGIGELGEVVEVQVQLLLNVNAPGSRYVDRHVPHPCLAMKGGAIADFLPHIAGLVHLFAGPARSLRTSWWKRIEESPLPSDEFRALIRGERAVASVAFSANVQPNGFWVRVMGTRGYAETNIYEPPRLILRRLRGGPAPLATLADGLAEAWTLGRSAMAGLGRKLGGVASNDGLPELVRQAYEALAGQGRPPISLEEMDDVARLVSDFTDPECMF